MIQNSTTTTTLTDQLQQKIDLKTKPLGALGLLEKLAFQIGKVQQSLNPKLINPTILLFAGDHGVAKAGVSAYPPEVTFQMVMNIVQGGAAVTVFCKQNKLDFLTIDAGVNYDFGVVDGLIDNKINFGTKNFIVEKAMSSDELNLCFEKSAQIVDQVAKSGCNVIGFGEMGIGNTSSASMIMHHVTKITLNDCIGRGTGVNDEQLLKKIELLTEANNFHGELNDPMEILQTYGGFEVAQICGAMIAAYKNEMLILVDGFIATSAFLVAQALYPEIKEYAVFCHNSNEIGHQKMLNYLDVKPILHLDMRVGEGTGCALAYPILENAVAFLNEMASFESAGVSNK
ncbi:nicotinate-nucleotide--dimethylbenzimidazole phosphoribosyltransferase [Faecalibacter macacae]|uniref:Nicotinate-nucleotide--dimethylbenzimidazole phosphoribosyltransferase n=1 Tax=Faecalibacter macacae TaxID=1859289 RepID=A0A3L9MD02_9FLAO|nr:nicotinate-nucleotide--dimethylbenzimidazole phosphoribosyltransferase [Faecalibacter macacae]RLZ10711.1 nicotinate-nucleotide--dimethylbenzimidazole phosphoribosyltransferase [Faecalibacter macacae]